MGEPLKDSFGPDVPARIGAMLAGVDPGFPVAPFVRDALDGYEALELTPRARLIAAALARHLPASFEAAADLVERSLGPVAEVDAGAGMSPFVHLPFSFWVAGAGLDHPERALALQHALTQRFTAEFSIRPYLERHPALTLATLRRWASDPSAHVRRLVSEGTRPRLPWAPRLRAFMRDPAPVLELLEMLRDDPEPYVRRSVANNLNDIGKDHPRVLLDVARRWIAGAPPERRRLVRHALRTMTRAGDPEALAILGVGAGDALVVDDLRIAPAAPAIGGKVRVTCRIANPGDGRDPRRGPLAGRLRQGRRPGPAEDLHPRRGRAGGGGGEGPRQDRLARPADDPYPSSRPPSGRGGRERQRPRGGRVPPRLGLAVQAPHEGRRVAVARGRPGGSAASSAASSRGVERQVQRGEVGVDVLGPAHAHQRDDVVSAREQPRQRDRRRRGAVPTRETPPPAREGDVAGRFSPWKRGTSRRQSVLARSSVRRIRPVRSPRASGL